MIYFKPEDHFLCWKQSKTRVLLLICHLLAPSCHLSVCFKCAPKSIFLILNIFANLSSFFPPQPPWNHSCPHSTTFVFIFGFVPVSRFLWTDHFKIRTCQRIPCENTLVSLGLYSSSLPPTPAPPWVLYRKLSNILLYEFHRSCFAFFGHGTLAYENV